MARVVKLLGLLSLGVAASIFGGIACGSSGSSTGAAGAAGTDAGTGGAAGAPGSAGSDAGGSSGAAGSAGASQCPTGKGDCDGVASNGCETDTTSDPAHCGACNTPCDGFCQSSKCSAVQVLASNQYLVPEFQGIAFAGGNVFWISSADPSGQSTQKYQVQKTSTSTPGTPTTLVSNSGYLDQIVAGLQRVYFVGTSQARILYSVKFDGSGLQQEVTNVYGIQFANNSYFYASNYNGAAYLKYKDVLTSATGTLYSLSGAAWNGEGVGSSFVADSNTITYAVNKATTNSYTIQDAHGILEQGGGYVSRIVRSSADLFWVERSPTQGQDNVAKYAQGSTSPVLVTQAVQVIDVAYQYPDAYISYEEGQSQNYQDAIDVFDVTSKTVTKTLLLQEQARSLEIDGSYLYFFLKDRLVRIQLPL